MSRTSAIQFQVEMQERQPLSAANTPGSAKSRSDSQTAKPDVAQHSPGLDQNAARNLSSASHSSASAAYLLNLQRYYGNRYVQRFIAAVKQEGRESIHRAPNDQDAGLSLNELMDRVAHLKSKLKTSREAAESLRLLYRQMSVSKNSEIRAKLAQLASGGDAIAQSVLDQHVRPNPMVDNLAKQGEARFSDLGKYDELVGAIEGDRAGTGKRRSGPHAVTPNAKTLGGVVGAAKTNVPGLESHTFVGRSPLADGGGINSDSQFSPATDSEKLPHTHGHAEQELADNIDAAFQKVEPKDLEGKTVWILIEQIPCSPCSSGTGTTDPKVEAGVLAKLSSKYPSVTFEAKHRNSSGNTMTLRAGKEIVVPLRAPKPSGNPPASGPAENPNSKPAAGEQHGSSRPSVPEPTSTEPDAGGGVKPDERVTEASRGEPLEAINEPGAHPGEGLEEGALQVLLSKQFENLQDDELEKYKEKAEALSPQIETLRNEGYNAVVTLIVVVPRTVNILDHLTGVATQDQLVRFHRLYISEISLGGAPKDSGDTEPRPNASMRPGPPLDPDMPGARQRETLDQGLKRQLGVEFPTEPQLDPNHRYASMQTTLKAYPRGTTSTPIRGLDGTYFVTETKRKFGTAQDISLYGTSRVLEIRHGNMTMRDLSGSESYSTEMPGIAPTLGPDLQNLYVLFSKRQGRSAGEYRITSRMSHASSKGTDRITEDAVGEDLDPQWSLGGRGKWAAVFVWQKL